jgi:hypothetical protein
MCEPLSSISSTERWEREEEGAVAVGGGGGGRPQFLSFMSHNGSAQGPPVIIGY